MFYIFEMANNHNGSVEHAKKIVDEFSKLAKDNNINAAVKLQFRNLDTFIHPDYKNSDLKFVKRFNSTRLEKSEFREIVEYIRSSGLTPMATPFDNESISMFEDMDIPIIKIASCSVDDWPLLKEVSTKNRKIIISTAGADMSTLKKVYMLMKSKDRDFAFMHCVGEYPTPVENSNLKRIKKLKRAFPDIEIGFSTHESPEQETMTPVAVAMGCTIVEKHVAVETDVIKKNLYSNTPEQMQQTIDKVKTVLGAIEGTSKIEKDTLVTLKRGAYLRKDLQKGSIVSSEDIYYAMPVQEGQYNASNDEEIIGKTLSKNMKSNEALYRESFYEDGHSGIISDIKASTKYILTDAGIHLSGEEGVEISCHYGVENFSSHGAVIIDKVNREYCKKLIVMQPKQKHPTHRHIKKEEAFELLCGDCKLILNGKEIEMKKGKPIVIARGVSHSFSSELGCVVEEISTTHIKGDSVYDDAKINTLELKDRKIEISL
jgi:N-acetylneuraminate synthase|tara:strand:- start:773 stop:2233 length:1461 start_codon:yes stop_codon:yes gene_type:complete